MKWISPREMEVNITVDCVTMRGHSDAPPLTWPAVVHVSTDDSEFSVGDLAIQETSAGTLVPLFGPATPPPQISKLECLTALFLAGFKELVRGYVFKIKPTVVVGGIEVLSQRLGGYERDLLSAALERAGAKEIRWVPNAHAAKQSNRR